MKKQTFITLLILLILVVLVTSCDPPSFGIWETHRHNIQKTPKYGVNDTVKHITPKGHLNGYTNHQDEDIFVIDSIQYRGKQIFYVAHYTNGLRVDYLPENSIKKI